MEPLIAWGLTTLIGAFVGSYLAGYLKKKGENLATHEDAGKLVQQTQAVTRATKEIEAQISNQVWDRQKNWEVKREAILGAMKSVATIKDALDKLHNAFESAHLVGKAGGNPDDPLFVAQKTDAVNARSQAFSNFQQANLVASVVFGKEVEAGFGAVIETITTMTSDIMAGETARYSQLSTELTNELAALTAAIRTELRIDKAD